MSERVHLCDFRSVPGETECWEAIWTVGKSCRKCWVEECYRRGWFKSQVDEDNRRLVEDKATLG